MYLEISNVAAALGKNPYESREKTLLVSWARHCPEVVMDYLKENKCIIPLKENEEYTEEDLPNPQSVYGKTKLKSDITVRLMSEIPSTHEVRHV